MRELMPYEAQPAVPASARRTSDFGDLGRFLSALWTRRTLFLLIAGGFTAFVVIVTLVMPKSYTATASVMPGTPGGGQAPDRQTSLPILNALVLQGGEQTAETFATLAQQRNIAEAVVRERQLGVDPAKLLGALSVKPVANTPILQLSVRWKSRAQAAELANAFATAFIDSERDFVRSQATAALGFLSTEMPAAQKRMHEAEQALAHFQASNGFVDASTHTQDVVTRSTNIDGQISTLQIDRREAVALLANIRQQLSTVPATVNNAKQVALNPVLTDLRTKLSSVELDLAKARQQYTERHPAVIALEKQRANLLAQIARQPAQIDSGDTFAPNPVYQSLQQQAAQYQARIDGDAAKLAELGRERTALAPVLRLLPSQGMELATLQQRAKLTSDVYNALAQKYNEATIARTTAISDISVVQLASPQSVVVQPSLRVNLLLGLVAGVLLASLIVFILDYFERTVHDAAHVRAALGLPVIASIPMFTSSNPRALPWLQSLTVEAFLHLCVWLRLSKQRPLRTIAITSPSQGDGKSTVAFNLAKAMANVQPRVLLIDGDLRHSSIHEMAGCKNDYGLADVLLGSMPLDKAVRQLTPQLDVLTSGRMIGNPIALLQSAVFDQVLHDAEARYTIIVIDTPPAGYVPDALSICSKADGTALVLAANSTEERAAGQVMLQFQSIGIDNILGVILNKDRARFHDYSDYIATSFHNAIPGGE